MPDKGEVGGWGIRGEFDSDTPADEDPRYDDNHFNPDAYVRVYVGDELGWKTFTGGVPLDDPDGYDIGDAIAEMEDRYGLTSS